MLLPLLFTLYTFVHYQKNQALQSSLIRLSPIYWSALLKFVKMTLCKCVLNLSFIVFANTLQTVIPAVLFMRVFSLKVLNRQITLRYMFKHG
jgi:hypothetical protein